MSNLFSVLSIILVVLSVIGILYRFLECSGIKVKKALTIKQESISYVPTRKELRRIFCFALLFRLFILIVGFVAFTIFKNETKNLNLSYLIKIWNRWDAWHYMDISKGYKHYIENGDYVNLVFFPLYSWLMAAVRLVFRNDIISGLITSIVCYSTACVFMFKLMCIDYSREVAKRSIVLMSVFPFAFFYGGIMTEATFIMTLLMTLYYIRTHKWLFAGVMGFFCALSRSVGVFIVIPAFVEFVEEYQLLKNPKTFILDTLKMFKKWVSLLLIPVAELIYLGINYKVSGNAFEFLRLEEKYWHQTAQPFFKTIGALWSNGFGGYDYSFTMASFIPGLFLFFAILALLLYDLRRQRTMYTVWLLIYILVNTTMSWPLSICRYMCTALPVYMSLGYYTAKNDRLYTMLLVAFGVLYGVFITAYFATGYVC